MQVKFIRTLHNQLIIGKVQDETDTIKIVNPYNVVPGVEGMEIYPMDKELVGREIPEIELYKTNLMYFTKPSAELESTYLSTVSGITVEAKPDIII